MFKKGELSIEVTFKYDEIDCQHCRYLRPDRIPDRYICIITNELIFKPKEGVDIFCPIKFEGE